MDFFDVRRITSHQQQRRRDDGCWPTVYYGCRFEMHGDHDYMLPSVHTHDYKTLVEIQVPIASLDYSVVAFLPVAVILVILVVVGCIYQYRKWRHERKQLDQLSWVYDVLEEVPCGIPASLNPGPKKKVRKKDTVVEHDETSPPSVRISSALLMPSSDKNPFFQPTNRNKLPRYDSLLQSNSSRDGLLDDCLIRVNSAREVIFHFTMLEAELESKGVVQHV